MTNAKCADCNTTTKLVDLKDYICPNCASTFKVAIPLAEYISLQNSLNWLCSLEAAGIDNTVAYEYVREIHEGDIEIGED